jgi:uncharacterized membrane protein YjgN (DUF898 family)
MDLNVRPYKEHPFQFTGNSSEFFGIWIVNIALTVLSLGIYSAWAKVRTHQYFYGNTRLEDSAFQYLAKPLQILKGRIFASLLFAIYYFVSSFNGAWGSIIALLIVAIIPAIIVLSASFKLRHTSYRGITFRFVRNFKQAYLIYGLPVLLLIALSFATIYYAFPSDFWQALDAPSSGLEEQQAPVSVTDGASLQNQTPDGYLEDSFSPPWALISLFPLFVLAFPFWQYLKTLFLVSHTHYGTSAFTFSANAKHFYLMYLKAIAVFAIAGILVTTSLKLSGLMELNDEHDQSQFFGGFALLQFLFIFSYFWIFAYLQTKRLNLIFNHIQLEDMSFKSTLSVSYMLYLYVTNTLGIICSFGLLIPWSMIRTMRYRVSQLTLLTDESLDKFLADQQTQLNALGEEFGEVFDIEIGI